MYFRLFYMFIFRAFAFFFMVGIAIKSEVFLKSNIRRLSKSITSLQKCLDLKWSVSPVMASH